MNLRAAIKASVLKVANATGMLNALAKIYLASKKVPQILTRPLKVHVYVLAKFSARRFSAAKQLFYHHGHITATLNFLDARPLYTREQREFRAFVEGLDRLRHGLEVPPRQPNSLLLPRRGQLLYCLHQSVPHTVNGYATRSHGIARGLVTNGWSVAATTRPGYPWDSPGNGLAPGRHESEVDGIPYIAVSGWSLNRTPLDYYIADAADHYFREAQTGRAEMIVAASNHITALPALIAARRLGLPFVYEVRGLWEMTQASTRPEWEASERYRLMVDLEGQAAQEADLLITLTEELADELVRRGVERERIVIVPNAVDAERFIPRQRDQGLAETLNLPPEVPVIGYAGSAVPYEGLELLMEALAKLHEQGVRFVFLMVGEGKAMKDVRARARELGIAHACRFSGRVPFHQVPAYLSCMDILPCPRLSLPVTEMVSPLKPLEAMAMGKAVVLSDVSPHKALAGDNERALLFEKDNAAALAAALQRLIENPDERIRLGRLARGWIEKDRTWDRVTESYRDALDALRERWQREQGETTRQGKTLSELTLGLIADRFTTDTLNGTVKLVRLSRENWRQELDQQPIDALFVESAWSGNDGQWDRGVGYYSDDEFASLDELLAYCRARAIPTLFWNKEDPVHFGRFRKVASLCDHVFTTDSRRIIPYLVTPGAVTKTASSCPFYASTKLHNLLPSTRKWQPTAAYGGTYYGMRYPERCEYLDKIMSAAAPLGLTIYDRQHDDPESPYKYPGGLEVHVAGGLSYDAMIQAYKAHPVQINVNSVLDSPTMFSRRVVEAAACGSALVSGPALGMNRYLDGAVHIVYTESDAAQALENLLHHPAYRWRVALKGARSVMRAHTAELRLSQMLRNAGMVISAPQPPRLQLVTDEISKAAATCLLGQTIRPECVVASQWFPGTQAQLEAAGIVCATPDGQSTQADSLWLVANPRALEDLEPEDLEDLAWPTRYAPQKRIGFMRDATLRQGQRPGVALESRSIEPGLHLVRPPAGLALNRLNDWAAQQPALALRKPVQTHQQAPNTPARKTMVIAGHDLKFIKPFYPYFTQAGIRILLDFWNGHNKHSETASERLVCQADTVFCEWMLGNAIWYGKHKREGQKLIGRLHAQELRSALFDQVPFEQFETVIFVGPHMLRNAQKRNPALKRNGVVIYNGVDVDAMRAVPRKPTNGKVLGLVGMVPQSKRLDRALDILKELRKDDDGYTLRVKGKLPEDYPWMAQRTEESAWFNAQYRRLEDDPDLIGAVFFDPHGNDMPEWYAGIDYVLSVSDHESFHLAVAEGAASGCAPVILPWEGADEIYPEAWIYPDAKAAANGIKAGPGEMAEVARFAKLHFNRSTVAQKLNERIDADKAGSVLC